MFKNIRVRMLCVPTMFVAIAMAAMTANAGFNYITGPDGCDFGNASNWEHAFLASDTLIYESYKMSGSPANPVVSLNDGSAVSVSDVWMNSTGSSKVLNQYGGSITAANTIIIGRNNTQTDYATWNLSGGSVTAASTIIGIRYDNQAYGTFNVSGGTFTSNTLTVGGSGAIGNVNITGGALTVNELLIASSGSSVGNCTMSNGTLSIVTENQFVKGSGTASFGFTGGEIYLTGNKVGFDDANAWFTPTAAAGYVYAEDYSAGTGKTLLHFVPVPEPATMTLLAMGMLGLIAYAWRKRK